MVDSAGIVLVRSRNGRTEVLLGHLGGPYWAKHHERAWSVPKGIVEPGEELLDAARREFTEELGVPVPPGDLVPLGSVRQSKKTVHVWALAADLDPESISPGTFAMEWPPRTGQFIEVPELDRVAWFGLDEARNVVVTAQAAFLDRLPAVSD